MKRLPILALALTGVALAQAPAPTPPTCPQTAGLEVGMSREAAFEMMRKKNPDPKTANVKAFHFAPANRPYQVDLTFASEAPDAKVVKLVYDFRLESKVLEAMRTRWGEPMDRPAPGTYLWNIGRCGVTVLYRPKLDEDKRNVGEELVVEPLPGKPSARK